MNLLYAILLLIICPFMLTCCGSGGYQGYKNRPYTVRGQHYVPMGVEQSLNYRQKGIASWYDESSFFSLKRGDTAIGEQVMPWHISGAHKTLTLPCEVQVTNLANGKTVKMRINDRGPFIPGRILDVSPRAARKLDFKEDGLTEVEIEVISVGDGTYKKKRKRKKLFFFF